jgi:hypothetical protein
MATYVTDTALGQVAESGNVYCSAAIDPRDNPTQPGEQTENRASEITCAAMRRLVIRDNLGDILKIIAVKARRRGFLCASGTSAAPSFREVLSFLGDAERGLQVLLALSPFPKGGLR